jgi:hypothetical protein
MKRCGAIVIAALVLGAGFCRAVETMSVDELQPGMRGVTHTVLKGTEVVTVDTEILGVAKDAIGPGLDLIIGKLVDPKTALTGAVHGMSGSPLYINGKLVGALSRRIAFFEKDGHCGFTPIADMLAVEKKLKRPAQTTATKALPMAADRISFALPNAVTPRRIQQADLLALPWTLGGIEPALWTRLAEAFGLPAGVSQVAVAGGSKTKIPIGPETLKPGSALAAMLMTGSISIAGTGTLTWREGDEILAFGHPMLGAGNIEIPMGTAEIITTVPSYEKPFKMSNPSLVIGTIRQDRMPAIAGIIGQEPPMAPYRITRTQNGEKMPVLEGHFSTFPQTTPVLIAAALQGIFMQQSDLSRQYTVNLRGQLKIAGHTPLKLDGYYSGQDFEILYILLKILSPVQHVYAQRFEQLRAQGLELDVEIAEAQRGWSIEEVRADSKSVEAGSTLNIAVVLQEKLGARAVKTVPIQLPPNIKSGSFTVRASAGDELHMDLLRRALDDAKDVEEIISLLNRRRAGNAVYVQVLTSAPGEVLAGKELTSLPPSVRDVMNSGANSQSAVTLNETVWREVSMDLPGSVAGRQQIQLEIKP